VKILQTYFGIQKNHTQFAPPCIQYLFLFFEKKNYETTPLKLDKTNKKKLINSQGKWDRTMIFTLLYTW
jgi:hypothetical protein